VTDDFLQVSEREVGELRQQMLAFTRLQLANDFAAEDIVQEALAGALKNAASFTRQANLKTWVFAILKHKITDHLRRQYREPQQDSLDECKNCGHPDDQIFNNELFDDRGHWHADAKPQRWGDADRMVHDEQFWRVFDTCLAGLPPEQGRVFMMREFIELDSDEICAALQLSTSNLHVLLYRARLRLRECLEDSWVKAGEKRS
jgi:RNA polymerase sigma-70 factor (ECF subfamily)